MLNIFSSHRRTRDTLVGAKAAIVRMFEAQRKSNALLTEQVRYLTCHNKIYETTVNDLIEAVHSIKDQAALDARVDTIVAQMQLQVLDANDRYATALELIDITHDPDGA